MNDPKMPYFAELIFEDDSFKRDFAELFLRVVEILENRNI